jgi:hypothetical protein
MQGIVEGTACDTVVPPVEPEGCCIAGSILAFCRPDTSTIVIQECLETEFGCVPTD